jgi:small subunit ribosomal protein S6
VNVGPAPFDTLGLDLGLALRLGPTGLRKACTKLACRIGAFGGMRLPALQERPQPEPSDQQREEALHLADATLPPLLVPSVAPSIPKRRSGDGTAFVHGKENSGTVNDYEIMLLLDPELAEERANEIIQRIRDGVDAAKGSWDGHEPWGRRRLTYEINHKGEAVYHLLLFSAPVETLDEITRVLKITDGVLRHGAYRRVKDSAHQKAPAQVPVGAPSAASAEDADDTDEASE